MKSSLIPHRDVPIVGRRYTALCLLAVLLQCGCESSAIPPAPTKADNRGGLGNPKMTDQIGEFDPNAGAVEVSNDVEITNPITGPLEAYQPLKRQIAGLGIDHALNLFNALEGRYPKDYEEFMQKVIKENNMKLPQLPNTMEYQYDVENHKLVVVMKNTGKAPDAQ